MQTISIIIPVFNEQNTIIKLLKNVNNEITKLKNYKFEIIVINDGSTDKTDELMNLNSHLCTKYISNRKNNGKGYAIKSALNFSNNEIIIIQDADLEYLPSNYTNLLLPFQEMDADVVYGSRFKTTHCNRVMFFWHYIANNIITFLSNIFTNLNFSDVEVGYKLFKKNLLKSILLKEKSFGFEIELTHKLARIKPKIKIFEVGISYNARGYAEGKKIGLKDAIRAIYCIFKYSFYK